MMDLQTLAWFNDVKGAEEALQKFRFLADEFRLQADRYAEHAAEVEEYLAVRRTGKQAEYPQGARYARCWVRLHFPEGKIVIAAPKEKIIISRESIQEEGGQHVESSSAV